MNLRVVFILTSSVNPNSIKRIDEFVSRGYEVKAYGFKRDLDVPNKSKSTDIEILGSYKNDLSYYKRCTIKESSGCLKRQVTSQVYII